MKVLFILLFSAVISGCNDNNTADLAKALNDNAHSILEIKAEISALRARIVTDTDPKTGEEAQFSQDMRNLLMTSASASIPLLAIALLIQIITSITHTRKMESLLKIVLTNSEHKLADLGKHTALLDHLSEKILDLLDSAGSALQDQVEVNNQLRFTKEDLNKLDELINRLKAGNSPNSPLQEAKQKDIPGAIDSL